MFLTNRSALHAVHDSSLFNFEIVPFLFLDVLKCKYLFRRIPFIKPALKVRVFGSVLMLDVQ